MADGTVRILTVPDLKKFPGELKKGLEKIEGTTRMDVGVDLAPGATNKLKTQVKAATANAQASGAATIQFTENTAGLGARVFSRAQEAAARARQAATIPFTALTTGIQTAVTVATKTAVSAATRIARIVFLPITSGIVPAVISATQSAIAAAQAQITAFQASVAAAGATLTRRLTVPILAVGGLAIKMGTDFESAMLKVQALTGATGDQFDELNALAKELGKTTQFSASQAGDAMGFLAQAGFDTDQILGSMESTLNLAAAAELDLAASADIVSNVLTGLGLEVSDLSHATDVLTAAFSSTNQDLSQLGDAFKFVGPVAAAAGVDIETTAAALGLLSNAGIQGGMAGTSFRRVITSLLNPNAKAAKVLSSLGVTAVDATGNLRPMEELLVDLKEAGFGLTDAMQIAGDRGGPALLTLVEASKELGPLAASFDDTGIAARQAELRMSGARGSVLRMKSAIEALFIAIAESGLLDTFADLAEKIASVASSAATANPNLLKLIAQIALGAAAFGPMLRVVSALISPLRAALGILAVLASPLGLLAVVIGAIATAVAVNLLPGFNTLESKTAAIRDLFANELVPWLERTRDRIIEFASSIDIVGILSTVGEKILEFVGIVRAVWSAFLSPEEGITSGGLAGEAEKIAITIRGVFDDLVGFIEENVLPGLQSFGTFIVEDVLPALQSLGDFILDPVLPALQDLVAYFITDIIPTLVDVVTGIVDFAAALVETAADIVQWANDADLLIPALAGISAVILAVAVPALASLVAGLVATAAAWVAAAAPAIALGLAIAAVVGAVVYAYRNFETFRNVVDKIGSVLKTIGLFIKDVFVKAWEELSTSGSTTRQVFSVIADIFTTVAKVLATVAKVGFGALTKAIEVVVGVVKVFIAAIRGIIDIGTTVVETIVGIVEAIAGFVEAIINFDFAGAFTTALETVTEAITGFIDGTVTFFTELPGRIVGALVEFGPQIAAAIGNGAVTVLAAVANLVGEILKFFLLLPLRLGVIMIQAVGFIIGALIRGVPLIATEVAKLIGTIVGFFIDLGPKIVAGIGDIGSTIWNGMQVGFDFVVSSIGTALDEAVQYFRDLPGNFVEGLGVIGDLIWGALTTGFDTVKTNISTFIGEVVTFFTELPGKIIDTLGDLGGTIWEAVKEGFSSFVTNVSDQFVNIATAIGTFITETVPNLAIDLAAAALDLGGQFIQGLVDGLTGAVGFLADIGTAVGNAVIGAINGVIDDINDVLEFDIPVPFGPDIHINPPDIPQLPTLFKGRVFGAGDGPQVASFNEPGNPEAVIPYRQPKRAVELLSDPRMAAVTLAAADAIRRGEVATGAAGHLPGRAAMSASTSETFEWSGDMVFNGRDMPENPQNFGIVVGSKVVKGIRKLKKA